MTITKNDTAAGYFLCRRSEADDLLKKAQAEAAAILEELKAYFSGDISIRVYVNTHVEGRSIAGDLMVDGEICRRYDPVDLCFLDLNELMLARIVEGRKETLKHGKE